MIKKVLNILIMLNGLVACQSKNTNPQLPIGNQFTKSPTTTPSPTPLIKSDSTPFPNPTPISSPSQSSPGPSNFHAELVDGEKPNEYSVKLTWSWDKGYQGKYTIIRTETGASVTNEAQKIELEPNVRDYLDSAKINNGVKYVYSISVENQIGPIGKSEVYIPSDVVFFSGENLLNSKFILQNDTYVISAHRIFFENGAKLMTLGKSIELNSDSTFLSGANINTRASLSWVNWTMGRGQVVETKNIPYGAKGENGGNVTIRFKTVYSIGQSLSKISIDADGSPGAIGFSGAHATPPQSNGRLICPSPHDGFPGGPGGDGGAVNIVVDANPEHVLFETNEISNRGGKGGVGGKPVLFGLDGSQGSDGKTGSVCISLENKAISCI